MTEEVYIIPIDDNSENIRHIIGHLDIQDEIEKVLREFRDSKLNDEMNIRIIAESIKKMFANKLHIHNYSANFRGE